MICLHPSQQFRQVADLDPSWQNTVKAVKLIRSCSDPFTPHLDLLGEFMTLLKVLLKVQGPQDQHSNALHDKTDFVQTMCAFGPFQTYLDPFGPGS